MFGRPAKPSNECLVRSIRRVKQQSSCARVFVPNISGISYIEEPLCIIKQSGGGGGENAVFLNKPGGREAEP